MPKKAWYKDVKIYRSKDVPWRVKCKRMVDKVFSVFCVGSENGCWSQMVLDRIKGWETNVLGSLLKTKRMEDDCFLLGF